MQLSAWAELLKHARVGRVFTDAESTRAISFARLHVSQQKQTWKVSRLSPRTYFPKRLLSARGRKARLGVDLPPTANTCGTQNTPKEVQGAAGAQMGIQCFKTLDINSGACHLLPSATLLNPPNAGIYKISFQGYSTKRSTHQSRIFPRQGTFYEAQTAPVFARELP